MDADGEAFLTASTTPVPGSDAPSLVLRRSETHVLKAVYGRDLQVPPSATGCATASPAGVAECFLHTFGASFGLASGQAQLASGEVRQAASGYTTVRFAQVRAGIPVLGRHVDVVLGPGLAVVGAFSTLALPLDAASDADLQIALGAHVADDDQSAVRVAARMDDLELVSSHEVLWPSLQGERYRAQPAVASVFRSPSRAERVLAIVDAITGAVLETRSQSAQASLPARELRSHVIHPAMDQSSSHPLCSTDQDCERLGVAWFCSDQFSPKRCVARCAKDEDCNAFQHYDCFPVEGNQDLGGYCYWPPVEPPPFGVTVYRSDSGWYNAALADHKAYSHMQESLDDLVAWHRDVCDVGNSYDGDNGDYLAKIYGQCYGCDTCGDPPCPCDLEYSACGPAGSVNFGEPWINLARSWYQKFADSGFAGRASAEFVLGHEFGHVLVGAAYKWEEWWPRGSVNESAADLYGALFAVHRLGEGTPWPRCGNFPGDTWNDDRAGLNAGCSVHWLKTYAYRSRFDLLPCEGAPYYSSTPCHSWADCPPYQDCVADPVTKEPVCGTEPEPHLGANVFPRLARILVDGAAIFSSDGQDEQIRIPDEPLGLDLTSRILSHANRSLSASADLAYWMDQVLFWASMEGVYGTVSRALGAAGFFPDATELNTGVTASGPVKLYWAAYEGYAYSKDFVATRHKDDVMLAYWSPSGKLTFLAMGADTLHRPALVAYRDYLHVLWLDRSTGRILGRRLYKDGVGVSSIYPIDPGEGQIRPNGAFDATVWQDRIYLVFGDTTKGSALTLAWCSSSTYCGNADWHDFGHGAYKKQVRRDAILPGPSADGTVQMNGMPWDEDDLWIFYATQTDGDLWISRVDASDTPKESFAMPDYYPSHQTDLPVGVRVKASAFGETCYPEGQPTRCDRMYLYLIWKDRHEKEIYTSVLQRADTQRSRGPSPASTSALRAPACPGTEAATRRTTCRASTPTQPSGRRISSTAMGAIDMRPTTKPRRRIGPGAPDPLRGSLLLDLGAMGALGVLLALGIPSCKQLSPGELDAAPLPGACGMEGQRIWCIDDMDCRDQHLGYYCNLRGECHSGSAQGRLCDDGTAPFSSCDNLPLVCGLSKCVSPCRSHEDCPAGRCICDSANGTATYNYCQYSYCHYIPADGGAPRCAEGTVPIQGNLVCAPAMLEGVCKHYYSPDNCREGYAPVGERGCEPLFDCGNGIKEPGEDCDGTDLGGETCTSVGFWGTGGVLGCAPDCGYDVHDCWQ